MGLFLTRGTTNVEPLACDSGGNDPSLKVQLIDGVGTPVEIHVKVTLLSSGMI